MAKLANIKKLMGDTGHLSKIKHIVDEAVKENYGYMFMGYPVLKELKDYAEGVLKAMPKAKFYPNTMAYISHTVNDENGTYQTTKQVKVVDEFFVYMDDFPFDLGRINYGDNAVTRGGSGTNTYAVQSRKISNAKFGTHRDQHYMMMTTDMGKAIKNASKYLAPYTNHELAQAFYEPLHVRVSDVLGNTRRRLQRIANPANNNYMALLAEVYALKKQGATFTTPEFREIADQVEEALGAYKEQEARQISAYFVRLKQIGDDTYADVQEVLGVRDNSYASRMFTNGTLAVSYPINELPQDVAGQIAVLNILEDEGYVANVGMKIDERTFWVERG